MQQIGIDIVELSCIGESLHAFGERFVERLYTEAESGYCRANLDLEVERLAVRFAAKEAAIKALGLSETGVGFRDIEVVRQPDGSSELQLHGRAKEAARRRGVHRCLVSLSHAGNYAIAVVASLRD